MVIRGSVSTFWVTLMTHFLFRIVVMNERDLAILRIHHVLIWGVSLVITFLPLLYGRLDQTIPGIGTPLTILNHPPFPPDYPHNYHYNLIVIIICSRDVHPGRGTWRGWGL